LTPSPVIATIAWPRCSALTICSSCPVLHGLDRRLGIGTATLFRKLKRYEHAG